MDKQKGLEKLRDLILQKLSVKGLSFSKSLELSDQLLKETKHFVSATTIQRFFGLISSQSAPSKFTLDALSQFVGFNNFEDIVTSCEPEDKRLTTESLELLMIKLSLKNKEYLSVLDFLKMLPVEQNSNKFKLPLGNILGFHLRNADPKTQKKLLEEFSKCAGGRAYFFENFVDVDYLHGYFGAGLDYYISNINVQHKPKMAEDLIFGYGLKTLGYVKLNKHKQAYQNAYQIISRFPLEKISKNFGIRSFPFGRLLFTHLTYAYLNQSVAQYSFKQLTQILQEKVNEISDAEKIFVISQFIEALFYAKDYKNVIETYLRYKNVIDTNHHYSYSYLPIATAVEKSLPLVGLSADSIHFTKKDPILYTYDNLEHAKKLL
ncbi:MAG: hypothetical protein ACXITV_12390 [Luteibaculaceae bacterium]